jgi:phenylacetate-CoA ligase
MNSHTEVQQDNLCRVVRDAYCDFPFYRNKLSQAGIAPESFQGLRDLNKIPFTTKEELQTHFSFVDLYQRLGRDLYYIGFTTGTTAVPMPIYCTYEDFYRWEQNLSKAFVTAGINPSDVVQISLGRCAIACVVFIGAVRKTGAAVMPVDVDLMTSHAILEQMKQFRVTFLLTFPSIASELCRLIEAGYPREGLALRTVFLMGEPWTEAFRERVRQTLGTEVYDVYGSTEMGFVAMECKLHKGLHIMSDQVLLEIVDPMTEQPVQKGAEGELVVTTFWKKASPLIRYRSGDIASAIKGDCECDVGTPRISRIKGRASDLIFIGSTKLHPLAIDGLIMDILDKTCNYQIVLSREEGQDKLTLVLEVDAPPKKAIVIQSRLAQEISTLTDDLNALIKAGIIAPPDTQLVAPGTLPRIGGKVRRIVDRRGQAEDK